MMMRRKTMTRFLSAFFLLSLCAFLPAAEKNDPASDDDKALIFFEGFDRFDPGKPGCFNDSVEIVEENGSKIARALPQKKNVLLAGRNNFHDIGGYNYTFRTRFRFLDNQSIGGLIFSFHIGGKRKDFKFDRYQIRLDRGNISVALNTKDRKNPIPLPKAISFADSGLPQFKEGRWYSLRIDVRQEHVILWLDLQKEGEMERFLDFNTNFGQGTYSLAVNGGTDVDFIKVSALDQNSGMALSSAETGENAVGPTNAADQAEKAGEMNP